jgi:SAM-dependent methyltransferase
MEKVNVVKSMKFSHAKEQCFICGKELLPHKSTRYLKCLGCGLVITNYVANSKSEEPYPADYYGREGVKFVSLFEIIRDLCLKYRVNAVKRKTAFASRRILDIGCGNGKFLNDMLRFGYGIYGVELQGPAFDAARRIRSINLVPEDKLSPDSFKEDSFSAITLWHTLEHINNPLNILIYCSRWIQKDGFLFIEVPNIDSYQARLFGNKWLHMDFPRHRFHFTAYALRLILEKTGFSVIDEAYFSLDMEVFGIIQSVLNLFIKPDNYLYSCMHRNSEDKFSIKEFLSIFLAIMLLPFALIFSLVEYLLRAGAVIRYVCRLS